MAEIFPNTLPAGLQRQHFLQFVLREFKKRILPITAFTTRFNDVPLEETDKCNVPFYPLTSAASKDFDKTTGYDFTGFSTTNTVEVTINKRKYQNLGWTSSDLRRQPMLNPGQLAVMIAEKLAQDVLDDIFSVITVANFGASPLAAYANAAAYNWNASMDIKDKCDIAMWPANPRALVLDSSYANNLFRDTNLAAAYAYGTAGGVAQGLRTAVSGFDVHSVPLLPANAEKLVGFAAYPTAVVVAFSPIRPTPEVEKLLTAYERVTDTDSNLTIEYRRGGDVKMDATFETIECNYGYVMGQASALKRLVSA